MKLSELTEEALLCMTAEQKWQIVCGKVRDDGESAVVAILLGSRPSYARERALAAAELYRAGRVRYIVPSGGVEWDCDGERLSEAHYMERILLAEGVPSEAIILENEARTTKENMIYGTLQINRALRFKGVDRVIIVTSAVHMWRSMELARTFLPRMVVPSSYPAFPKESVEEWLSDPENVGLLDRAIVLMKGLVRDGFIADQETEVE